jgi:hypothetical protein
VLGTSCCYLVLFEEGWLLLLSIGEVSEKTVFPEGVGVLSAVLYYREGSVMRSGSPDCLLLFKEGCRMRNSVPDCLLLLGEG